MAEEDNPKIRRHLGEIEGWQIADDPLGLNYLDVDIRAARFAWLRSIRPTFELAWYDDVSKRPNFAAPAARRGFWDAQSGTSWSGTTGVLANLATVMSNKTTGDSTDGHVVVTNTSYTTATQTNFTLTVPANRAYKVICATLANATRAPTVAVIYTPSGGTATTISSHAAAIAQVSDNVVLGGVQTGGATSAVIGPLWMQAGDTLILDCTNFVAADDTEYSFTFEEYVV
jgi:hypothetical protein